MNLAFLAAAYAQLGDQAAAARTREELARIAPFFDGALVLDLFRTDADRALLREGFVKAGIRH